jgi:hypothetical protein
MLTELFKAAPSDNHHHFPDFHWAQGRFWDFQIDPLCCYVTQHPTPGWGHDVFPERVVDANCLLVPEERYWLLSDCAARSPGTVVDLLSLIYIIFCYERDKNVSCARVHLLDVLQLTCYAIDPLRTPRCQRSLSLAQRGQLFH